MGNHGALVANRKLRPRPRGTYSRTGMTVLLLLYHSCIALFSCRRTSRTPFCKTFPWYTCCLTFYLVGSYLPEALVAIFTLQPVLG